MQALTLLLLFMALSLHIPLSSASSEQQLHPIILIPGNGGNQLEARLSSEYKPSSLFCKLSYVRRRNEWFRIWFDPSVVVAPITKCFAERMMLYYHPELDDYRNAPGVETRVPYFGSTQGIRYLDPHLKHISEYMGTLITSLEQIGYEENHTLFGAPYDFRYGLAHGSHPCQVGTRYLQDLKNLIESASNSTNGGRPVILIAHSLGGLFALQLLNRNPPSWRRQYVKHLIALSVPWGGTVDEMLTFASGYTLGVPLVDPLLVRGEQRSSESNLWLLPSPKPFGRKPLVMSSNGGKNYSAMDMAEFLKDIGFGEGVGPYEGRILPLVEELVEPEVPITCMVGHGVDTAEGLVYGMGGFDVQPDVVYGDGDGTVNLNSLLRLESEWSGSASMGQDLKVIKFRGVSHAGILKSPAAHKEIVRVISEINSDSLILYGSRNI
ncbi:lecithin-cholesterol acyltransferase-like 1 [Typha latifolia]|uniref:lecithin-cholesterol acyltransferase-like 1 n=1 Tax=Typha latifolia TaxID=4733 RepID=UPI003C2ABFD5